jgi:hypothetical protein
MSIGRRLVTQISVSAWAAGTGGVAHVDQLANSKPNGSLGKPQHPCVQAFPSDLRSN